jgi:hypothetical protein
MTNFEAINEFRRLHVEHEHMVPELLAHHFAGITRQRWNQLRRSLRGLPEDVPIYRIAHFEFVPLTWLETRTTRRGRQGWLSRSRMQLERAPKGVIPLPSVARPISGFPYTKPFKVQNGSNSSTIQAVKPCKARAKSGLKQSRPKKGKLV